MTTTYRTTPIEAATRVAQNSQEGDDPRTILRQCWGAVQAAFPEDEARGAFEVGYYLGVLSLVSALGAAAQDLGLVLAHELADPRSWE